MNRLIQGSFGIRYIAGCNPVKDLNASRYSMILLLCCVPRRAVRCTPFGKAVKLSQRVTGVAGDGVMPVSLWELNPPPRVAGPACCLITL